MKDYRTENLRNIAILGHASTGKTSITEAMLFSSGAIVRLGKTDDGTTTADYDAEEIKRKISISSAMVPIDWDGHRLTVIDTPGYFDFTGEVSSALKMCDSAVIAIDAVSGVQVGAEKAWEFVEENKIPGFFFVNKMDRENADFGKVVNQLRNVFGNRIVPFEIPIGSENNFIGVVDVVEMEARVTENMKCTKCPIPEELKDTLDEYREMIIEAVAQTDEVLLEKYLGGEQLSLDEMHLGLRTSVLQGDIIPVVCGCATKNIGVMTLMDLIHYYMPTPKDAPRHDAIVLATGEERAMQINPDEPFSAQIFKTVADPFVGKISMFKVITGQMKSDMEVINTNKDKKEKLNGLFYLLGKNKKDADIFAAGDIGCVAKLQYSQTGDTLCDPNFLVKYTPIDLPKPTLCMAIEPKAKGDEDKIGIGLQRLVEEDPTLRVEKNTETKQTLIYGMGEQHLEIVCKKLLNKFGVDVALKEPIIPYRETIKGVAKAEGKHKKQSGGHGQFGHVCIEFAPTEDKSIPYLFIDKVVGGAVPRNYIPAVDKGLQECLVEGILAGYPVVNLQCTLYDGSFHPVDSSEMSFKMASSLAYKKGMAEAKPVLLEPINHIEVYIPDNYMGDIIGDLNKKRGRILGMEKVGKLQRVTAEAPLAELSKYATDLRSMTQARGNFEMHFVRYEELPPMLAEKVIAAAAAKHGKEA